jgi:hypothetical protein
MDTMATVDIVDGVEVVGRVDAGDTVGRGDTGDRGDTVGLVNLMYTYGPPLGSTACPGPNDQLIRSCVRSPLR